MRGLVERIKSFLGFDYRCCGCGKHSFRYVFAKSIEDERHCVTYCRKCYSNNILETDRDLNGEMIRCHDCRKLIVKNDAMYYYNSIDLPGTIEVVCLECTMRREGMEYDEGDEY